MKVLIGEVVKWDREKIKANGVDLKLIENKIAELDKRTDVDLFSEERKETLINLEIHRDNIFSHIESI